MLHSLAFIIALIVAPRLAVLVFTGVIGIGGTNTKISLTFRWQILAIVVAVLGVVFSHAFKDPVTANFVMHAIGGGVVSFCLMMHVLRQLKIKLTWFQLALVMLATVCVLGVANELFEYVLELLKPGRLIFSLDTHDTWRDLAANLLGSVVAFVIYRFASILNRW